MKKERLSFQVGCNLDEMKRAVYIAWVESQIFICRAFKGKVMLSNFLVRWFWKYIYRKEFNRLKSIRKEYYERTQRHTYF